VRHVGVDGGRTLEWTGRIVVVAACTTAWDQAHSVIATMGDRFVSDSRFGRLTGGRQAMKNSGSEVQMRKELAEAVAGIVANIPTDTVYISSREESESILQAANLVTLARTGVELDYRGDVIDAHDPEAPTRFTKQLTQIVRGAIAIGVDRPQALRLALRVARDSMPQLRLAVLRDVAANPSCRVAEVRRRLQKPRATIDRALQALHTLGLLRCSNDEEAEPQGEKAGTWWRYSLARGVDLQVLDDQNAGGFS
jgi:hypothetical protein